MSEYFFRRYRNGERMAEDVSITQAATLEEATLAASRIAAQYRDGTVLVSECEVDLRAELAAERERADHAELAIEGLEPHVERIEAENDALRAALKIANETLIEALEYIDDPYNELAVYIGERLARIETTMNKGDFDRDNRAYQREFRDFGYTPGGRKLSIGERIKHAEGRAAEQGRRR